MKKIYLTVLIVFISITFSLYLTEGYINYKLSINEVNVSKKIKLYEKEKNNKFDVRSKLQVYRNLIKKNSKITSVSAPSFMNDPNKKLFFLSGISNSKTISCNENGYYSIFESDRYGFNNPDNEWDKEEIEFLLLGDSYAQGACVNRPNDITSVLRGISKKSALNFGYRGSGPLMYYATLLEYYKKNTKNILWLHFEGNDLSDLKLELTHEILKNYYSNNNFKQNLKQKQNYVDIQTKKIILEALKKDDDKIEDDNKNLLLKYKILKFIRLNHTKTIIKSIFKKKEKDNLPFKEFEEILILAKKFDLKNNSNFYFIYLPQHERYNQKIQNKNYHDVKKIVKNLEINFIDVHEELFIKLDNPLDLFPFKMWGHYNEIGYDKVARFIYSKIKN